MSSALKTIKKLTKRRQCSEPTGAVARLGGGGGVVGRSIVVVLVVVGRRRQTGVERGAEEGQGHRAAVVAAGVAPLGGGRGGAGGGPRRRPRPLAPPRPRPRRHAHQSLRPPEQLQHRLAAQQTGERF